jgi:hypothetical protein
MLALQWVDLFSGFFRILFTNLLTGEEWVDVGFAMG